jgi:hypothetical protein
MPFKSNAQRAKFAELVKSGKMSQSTFDEWNKATGDAKLPERIEKKTKGVISGIKPIKGVK